MLRGKSASSSLVTSSKKHDTNYLENMAYISAEQPGRKGRGGVGGDLLQARKTVLRLHAAGGKRRNSRGAGNAKRGKHQYRAA